MFRVSSQAATSKPVMPKASTCSTKMSSSLPFKFRQCPLQLSTLPEGEVALTRRVSSVAFHKILMPGIGSSQEFWQESP